MHKPEMRRDGFRRRPPARGPSLNVRFEGSKWSYSKICIHSPYQSILAGPVLHGVHQAVEHGLRGCLPWRFDATTSDRYQNRPKSGA
jgi:hypothetical protein